MNRAVSVIACSEDRVASSLINRLTELHNTAEFAEGSGAAELNVPNSSSAETLGVCCLTGTGKAGGVYGRTG